MARIRLLIASAVYCAVSVAWLPMAAPQTAEGGAKTATPGARTTKGATAKTVPVTGGGAPGAARNSLTDSPYEKGAPPITGGYTDTSQGGKKTSGDPLAVPPGAQKAPAESGK